MTASIITQGLIEDLRQLNSEEIRVLVVEDNEMDAELLSKELEKLNFHVLLEKTAEDALEKIKASSSCPFQMIFLDLKLPQMDGVQFLREVRKYCPHIHVVLVTGYLDHGVLNEARKLGYVGLIEKPLQSGNLQDILMKHNLISSKVKQSTEITQPTS